MTVESISYGNSYAYRPVYSQQQDEYLQEYNAQHRYNMNDEEVKGIVGSNTLGSARTEVVKKGAKYFWSKFKNFIVKVFKGDEEAHKQLVDIYDYADKAHKTIHVINDLQDRNNNTQNYKYLA